MIAVNTGFGDAYSAAQEVEYCNGSAETIGGSWRAKNGHAEPYGVKYWCVGNEMFGPWQLGFMQLSHYVQKHNRVAQRDARSGFIDPAGRRGQPGRFQSQARPRPESRLVRRNAAGMWPIDGLHLRALLPGPHTLGARKADVAGHVGLLRDSIREKADGHRKLQEKLGLLPDRMIPIAMDEWNYWHSKYVYGELGCVYDLADALGVAAGLHEYFRNTDIIQMAHYAQTVNVIGCIKTTKTDAFLSTTALPLMLYRQHFGTTPVTSPAITRPKGSTWPPH